MNQQTQNAITVLVSSLVFGSAGLWLAPQAPKAGVVGALAGAAGAIGYAQQNNRFRQLAAQQQQLLSRKHNQPQIDKGLHRQLSQTTKTFETVAQTTTDHGTRISDIERILRPHVGQSKLSQNEINHIRKRLETLEAQIELTTTRENSVNPTLQPIELKLDALEAQIQSIISNRSIGNTELLVDSDHEDISSDDETAQTVIQWFNHRQMDVENYYEPDAKVDDLLDGLSLYLGDHYSILRQFHWRLRNGVGRRVYINLSERDPREKSIHNQFLKKLRSCDYLSFGRMIKDSDGQDYILATPYRRPDVQGFLNGVWFERFVYYKIVELLNSEGVEYQCLRNLKITYPDGHNAELDLFFLINNNPLLIECKASPECDMNQIVGYRDRLNLAAKQALLVSLNIDDAEAHLRSKNWKIDVANQDSFLDYIRRIIPAETDVSLQPDAEEVAVEITEAPSQLPEPNDSIDDDLKEFFKKRGLNQAAEARTNVLMALIRFFEGNHEPINFNELTKMVRDEMRGVSAISRNRIIEILNCLRYSDIFRDENNKPIHGNVSQPIYSMASTKQKTLERKCVEFYADKVTQLLDPDFFRDSSNCHEFERLTGGEVPAKYRQKLDE